MVPLAFSDTAPPVKRAKKRGNTVPNHHENIIPQAYAITFSPGEAADASVENGPGRHAHPLSDAITRHQNRKVYKNRGDSESKEDFHPTASAQSIL